MVAVTTPVVNPPPVAVTPVTPVVSPPVAVVPPKVPTPNVVPPIVQPVAPVVAQVQKPVETTGAKVTAQEVAVIPPKTIVTAPVVTPPVVTPTLVIAPAHSAASVSNQPRIPYGQIMVMLAGLLFVLAGYFLIGDEEEMKTRVARG